MDCPVCANGVLAIYIDARMKMRCALFYSKSAAPPLGIFGGVLGPIYIDPQGNAVDISMERQYEKPRAVIARRHANMLQPGVLFLAAQLLNTVDSASTSGRVASGYKI